MTAELVISIGFLAILVVLLNPFGFFMPTYLAMMVLAGAVVLFGLFAVFVWREGRGDERENFHRLFAGRVAFLAGAGVLLLAIIWQELEHVLDPWIVIALFVMIVAKVAGIMYGKNKL